MLLKRDYKYDAAGQLIDIHDSRRGPLSYRYDPASNLLDEQNQQVQRPLEQNPKRN